MRQATQKEICMVPGWGGLRNGEPAAGRGRGADLRAEITSQLLRIQFHADKKYM